MKNTDTLEVTGCMDVGCELVLMRVSFTTGQNNHDEAMLTRNHFLPFL